MTITSKLALELLQNNAANQTLANTTFAQLNQIVQAGVVDKDLSTPPGSPADESLYIVASSPTGSWSGQSGKLAYWLTSTGAWQFITPREGMLVHVNDEDLFYKYNGSSWVTLGGDMLSQLLNSEVSVTGAVTLTSTAFGKLHVCTGTTIDYTVGLPAVSGNAGKFIGLRMSPALTKIVTIDPNGAETINGATTRKMAANETVILYCDGSAWVVLARGDRAVLAFSASKVSPVQSIANGTSTKITFETEDFDFGSNYNPATSVFTVPANGAGKWVFGASLVFQGTAGDDVISIRLYKNGSQVGNIGHAPAGRPNTGGPSGITLIDVAVGDTLEIYGRLDTTSGARDVYGATGTSRFYGFKVD